MPNWTEQNIIDEITRLDRKTNMNGRGLEIKFINSRRTLGRFVVKNGSPDHFEFSLVYLNNPDFSEKEFLDLVRHEYAHYLNYMLHGIGKKIHGPSWKACCQYVGAKPSPYYNARNNLIRLKEQKSKEEKRQNMSELMQTIHPGQAVHHPIYGEGVITRTEQEDINGRVEVCFEKVGIKIMSSQWIKEKGLIQTA